MPELVPQQIEGEPDNREQSATPRVLQPGIDLAGFVSAGAIEHSTKICNTSLG